MDVIFVEIKAPVFRSRGIETGQLVVLVSNEHIQPIPPSLSGLSTLFLGQVFRMCGRIRLKQKFKLRTNSEEVSVGLSHVPIVLVVDYNHCIWMKIRTRKLDPTLRTPYVGWDT